MPDHAPVLMSTHYTRVMAPKTTSPSLPTSSKPTLERHPPIPQTPLSQPERVVYMPVTDTRAWLRPTSPALGTWQVALPAPLIILSGCVGDGRGLRD